jgi:hexosaminidase
MTLKQIIMQINNNVSFVDIFDEPDLANRGLMLDISRNRVYNVNTIKRLIDKLSDLKLNELQFNVEGNSFYYPSKAGYYDDPTDYLTTEDVKEIDAYAKQNCIRFIPNQNSMGHMGYWLAQEEFKHLAECPDGFTYKWMINSPPSTLNPLLPETLTFVTDLYNDMLTGFSEKTFNIGGDEPFELGFGESKAACEASSKGEVYIEFILKLKQYFKDKGMSISMWGDVIKNHPDLLNLLPKDIIALEWGYDIHDFDDDARCKLYLDAGFEYYVCPGTSMWNSVAGIHQNMLGNIKSAARTGYRNQASGLLNTDWGDGGSWQQLSLSLFPFFVGCAYSWNSEVEQDNVILDYLDEFTFNDKNKKTARFLFDLGSYSLIEETKESNATQLFKLLYIQQTDHMNFDSNPSDPLAIIKDERKLTNKEYLNYIKFFEDMFIRYEACDIQADDQQVINDEILFTLKILSVGAKLGAYQTNLHSHKKDEFISMTARLGEAIKHYEDAWQARNKKSDIKLSTYRMKSLYRKFKAILNDDY